MTAAGVICTGGIGYLINRLIKSVDRLDKNIQALSIRVAVVETRFDDATGKQKPPVIVRKARSDDDEPTTTT